MGREGYIPWSEQMDSVIRSGEPEWKWDTECVQADVHAELCLSVFIDKGVLGVLTAHHCCRSKVQISYCDCTTPVKAL